jgi:hypothetical protein
LGGNTLLSKYNESVAQLLTTVYPEHKWEIYKFSYLNAQQWHKLLENADNKREYIKFLEKELKIENEEGWKQLESHSLIPSWRYFYTLYAFVT